MTRSSFSLTTEQDVNFIFILRSFGGSKADLLCPLFFCRYLTFKPPKYSIHYVCTMTRSWSWRELITAVGLIEYWVLKCCCLAHTLGSRMHCLGCVIRMRTTHLSKNMCNSRARACMSCNFARKKKKKKEKQEISNDQTRRRFFFCCCLRARALVFVRRTLARFCPELLHCVAAKSHSLCLVPLLNVKN